MYMDCIINASTRNFLIYYVEVFQMDEFCLSCVIVNEQFDSIGNVLLFMFRVY